MLEKEVTFTVPTQWVAVAIVVVVLVVSIVIFWQFLKRWILPLIDKELDSLSAIERGKVNAKYGQDDHSGSEQ